MFKSKVRSINIPQYEHGRLAGTFALLWGNDDFDQPALDFASFVRGVALHDWHYGIIDNLPIGEAKEADWLATARQGVAYWFDDPITDIVAKLHLKRLLARHGSAETDELANQIELRIAERMPHTLFARAQFEWADKITCFCDQLAFDFSFEEPVEDRLSVFSEQNTHQDTSIAYSIKPGGKVQVGPWPFSVDSFSGIITGYQQAGYPDKLTPEIIHFQVYKRTT